MKYILLNKVFRNEQNQSMIYGLINPSHFSSSHEIYQDVKHAKFVRNSSKPLFLQEENSQHRFSDHVAVMFNLVRVSLRRNNESAFFFRNDRLNTINTC